MKERRRFVSSLTLHTSNRRTRSLLATTLALCMGATGCLTTHYALVQEGDNIVSTSPWRLRHYDHRAKQSVEKQMTSVIATGRVSRGIATLEVTPVYQCQITKVTPRGLERTTKRAWQDGNLWGPLKLTAATTLVIGAIGSVGTKVNWQTGENELTWKMPSNGVVGTIVAFWVADIMTAVIAGRDSTERQKRESTVSHSGWNACAGPPDPGLAVRLSLVHSNGQRHDIGTAPVLSNRAVIRLPESLSGYFKTDGPGYFVAHVVRSGATPPPARYSRNLHKIHKITGVLGAAKLGCGDDVACRAAVDCEQAQVALESWMDRVPARSEEWRRAFFSAEHGFMIDTSALLEQVDRAGTACPKPTAKALQERFVIAINSLVEPLSEGQPVVDSIKRLQNLNGAISRWSKSEKDSGGTGYAVALGFLTKLRKIHEALKNQREADCNRIVASLLNARDLVSLFKTSDSHLRIQSASSNDDDQFDIGFCAGSKALEGNGATLVQTLSDWIAKELRQRSGSCLRELIRSYRSGKIERVRSVTDSSTCKEILGLFRHHHDAKDLYSSMGLIFAKNWRDQLNKVSRITAASLVVEVARGFLEFSRKSVVVRNKESVCGVQDGNPTPCAVLVLDAASAKLSETLNVERDRFDANLKADEEARQARLERAQQAEERREQARRKKEAGLCMKRCLRRVPLCWKQFYRKCRGQCPAHRVEHCVNSHATDVERAFPGIICNGYCRLVKEHASDPLAGLLFADVCRSMEVLSGGGKCY